MLVRRCAPLWIPPTWSIIHPLLYSPGSRLPSNRLAAAAAPGCASCPALRRGTGTGRLARAGSAGAAPPAGAQRPGVGPPTDRRSAASWRWYRCSWSALHPASGDRPGPAGLPVSGLDAARRSWPAASWVLAWLLPSRVLPWLLRRRTTRYPPAGSWMMSAGGRRAASRRTSCLHASASDGGPAHGAAWGRIVNASVRLRKLVNRGACGAAAHPKDRMQLRGGGQGRRGRVSVRACAQICCGTHVAATKRRGRPAAELGPPQGDGCGPPPSLPAPPLLSGISSMRKEAVLMAALEPGLTARAWPALRVASDRRHKADRV